MTRTTHQAVRGQALPAAFLLSLLLAACEGTPGQEAFEVIPATTNLHAKLGEATSGSIKLKNLAPLALSYEASTASPHLTISGGASGTIPVGQDTALSFQATCKAEGVFQDTFTITTPWQTKTSTITLTCTTTPPAADSTPDAFSFVDTVGAPLGTLETSNAVTVSGINVPTPISVTGGTLLIDGQPSTATTVTNGQTVAVRVLTSTQFSTPVSATVTIGGVSDTFTVTTKADSIVPITDTTPNPFAFTDVTGQPVNTPVTSNVITVSGINAPTPIAVTGGTLLIGGQPSTASTVTNGQKIAVRVTTSSAYSTPTSATVTIGGVSDTFTATTKAANALVVTPNALAFTASNQGQTVTLSKAGYSGPFDATHNCSNVAKVNFVGGNGPSLTVDISSIGAGKCQVTFKAGAESAVLNISVTTTNIIIQSFSQ